MFGQVTGTFEDLIVQEPEPVTATPSNAFTVSRESISVGRGQDIALKFGVYNGDNVNTRTFSTDLVDCTTGANEQILEEKDKGNLLVPSKTAKIISYVYRIQYVEVGTHICTIKGLLDTTEVGSVDITFNIK